MFYNKCLVMKKFKYTIIETGDKTYKLTITEQDRSIKRISNKDYSVTKCNGWKIKIASSVEVNCSNQVIFLVGDCGMGYNSSVFLASPNELLELKKTLEEFRLKYCKQENGNFHNHPLTDIFSDKVINNNNNNNKVSESVSKIKETIIKEKETILW